MFPPDQGPREGPAARHANTSCPSRKSTCGPGSEWVVPASAVILVGLIRLIIIVWEVARVELALDLGHVWNLQLQPDELQQIDLPKPSGCESNQVGVNQTKWVWPHIDA